MTSGIHSSVTIAIENIDDAALVAQVEATIRRAFGDAGLRGRWTVALAASEARGRWNVAIKGPALRHLMSFTAALDRLPENVARHLARALAQLTPTPTPTRK